MKPFRDGDPREILTALMAVIGALAVVFVPIVLAAVKLAPTYERTGREVFGTPEALADLAALYSKIEAAPHDDALRPVTHFPPVRGKSRRIPRAWLPPRFAKDWGTDSSELMVRPPDVFAYYDAEDRLIGVQFGSTRSGCFLSREPMACPRSFGSLHRLQGEPLYVTLWIE